MASGTGGGGAGRHAKVTGCPRQIKESASTTQLGL